MKNGPAAAKLMVGQPIELVRDDLSRLVEGKRVVSSIKNIRASHHRIARLTAAGLKGSQVAAYVGMSRERVTQLLTAPAMIELVAKYMEKIEERESAELDAYLTLKTSNMIAAERHISDHIAELDDAGELLPVRTALAISADGADRTGYGKRQTNLNINADLGAALEKAIARSGKTINSVANHRPNQPLALSSPRPMEDSPRSFIARRA